MIKDLDVRFRWNWHFIDGDNGGLFETNDSLLYCRSEITTNVCVCLQNREESLQMSAITESTNSLNEFLLLFFPALSFFPSCLNQSIDPKDDTIIVYNVCVFAWQNDKYLVGLSLCIHMDDSDGGFSVMAA